ncbi:MAG: hypothetical protein V7776_02175 [Halopseudomonas aestusnigri]
MAQDNYAANVAIRDSVLGQTQNLSDALGQAYNIMGPQQAIDPAQIHADYSQIKTNSMEGFNQSLDRINSQGSADLMSRGLSDSTNETIVLGGVAPHS